MSPCQTKSGALRLFILRVPLYNDQIIALPVFLIFAFLFIMIDAKTQVIERLVCHSKMSCP